MQQVSDSTFMRLRRTFERLSKAERLKVSLLSQILIAILSLITVIPTFNIGIIQDIAHPFESPDKCKLNPAHTDDPKHSAFQAYIDVINGLVETLLTFIVPPSLFRSLCRKFQYETKMRHVALVYQIFGLCVVVFNFASSLFML